jgi:ubiquinone biosynthesis protein UbiJ
MLTLPPPLLGLINHLLAQSEWARQRLQPFAGCVAQFDMPPFEGAFTVTTEGQIAAPSAETYKADVTICLPALSPLLLLQGIDTLMRSVRLEGGIDFAEALGFVLRNLRWDAEEDLSRVVGDIAAHRLVNSARKFAGWQQQAAQNLAENFAEYFTEEEPLIAGRAAIADFSAAVETLRDDLARLEKRLQRLA